METLDNENNFHLFIDSTNISTDEFVTKIISSPIFGKQILLSQETSSYSNYKLNIRLPELFKDLHFNLVNKILTIISNSLQDFFQQNETNVILISNTCDLLFLFLQNICINNIPEKISQKISSNFELLLTYLTKLLKRDLKNVSTDNIVKYLCLLRTSFELIIILPEESCISQFHLNKSILKDISTFYDFTFIFPKLKSKIIKKVQNVSSNNFNLKIELILIMVAKLRYMLKIHELNSSIINEMRNFILEDMMEVINEDVNYVKYWETICLNFHILYESNCLFETNSYLKIFSRKILYYLLNDNSLFHKSSKNFILNWKQSGFSQMSDLHYTLVEEIAISLDKNVKSTGVKKRKLDPNDETSNNCIEILKLIEINNKSQIKNLFEQSLKYIDKSGLRNESTFSSIAKISLEFFMPHFSSKLKAHLVIMYMMQTKFVSTQMNYILISILKSGVYDRQCCAIIIELLDILLLIQFMNNCIENLRNENSNILEECFQIRSQLLFNGLRMTNQILLLDDYFNQVHLNSKITNDCLSMLEMIHLMEQILKILLRHYIRDDIKNKLISFLSIYINEYYRFLQKLNFKKTSISDEIFVDNNVEIEVLFKGFVYSIQGISINTESLELIENFLLEVPSILQFSIDLILKENYLNIKNSIFSISYIFQNLSNFKPHISDDNLFKLYDCLFNKILHLVTKSNQCNQLGIQLDSKNIDSFKDTECFLLKKLCSLMPMILFAFEPYNIEIHIKELTNQLQIENNDENLLKKLSMILIWNEVLSSLPSLHGNINEIIFKYNQKVLVIYSLLIAEELNPFLSIHILNSVLKYTTLNSNFFGSQELSLCCQLFSIVGSKLFEVKKWDFEDVISFMHFHHLFLNNILLYHQDVVFMQISTFVGHVRLLLRNSLYLGDQNITRDEAKMNKIISVSHLLYRLSNLMCEYKIHFSKVVLYLISEYVCLLQTITLYPLVKHNLEPAIHKWIDMSSTFAISHLHVSLPHAGKEIFKNIYSEFVKYYKYKRRN